MSLDELFSTFHDFDIVGLESKNNNLLITFVVPWGELWNEFDFKIKVELIEGQIIECKYFEYTDECLSSGQSSSIYKITRDLRIIEKLGIDIQRFDSIRDGEYIFYCNGYDKVGGAQIRLRAIGYQLLDLHDQSISNDKYESWHNDWWKKIME